MNILRYGLFGLIWGNFVFGHSGRVYVTDDFYVEKVEQSFKREAYLSNPVDCRQKIEQSICLVNPKEQGQHDLDRKCLDGSSAYASTFKKLHDAYPLALQRMFCSLDRIFIEKTTIGTAYAGVTKDADGQSIAVMGIRKSVLDEALTLSLWASWKEQLSFGGIVDKFQVTLGLPLIKTAGELPVSDFLYLVIAHEFGHLFDFANKLNKFEKCTEPKNGEPPICSPSPESWGAISWATGEQPKVENDFFRRNDLCFYWCQNKFIARSDMPQLYREFYFQSDFMTLYSSKNPYDDFAESFAFVLLRKHPFAYSIELADGSRFDALHKVDSDLFAKKRNYIESFLIGEIIYP